MPLTLCVLLWPDEGHEAELVAYEDRVLPLVADHRDRAIARTELLPVDVV